jgi:hypothetical protein
MLPCMIRPPVFERTFTEYDADAAGPTLLQSALGFFNKLCLDNEPLRVVGESTSLQR